jgi:PEGA domain
MPCKGSHSLSRALLCLGMGLPEVCFAQSAAPSTGGPGTAEVASVRRAQRARDAASWAEAAATFRSVLEAAEAEGLSEARRAELVGELGLCELALREYRDAAEHMALSLRYEKPLPKGLVKRLQRGYDAALEHVARLYVSVSPPEAAVLVDGRPLGRTAQAYEIFLDPGRHTIRARMTGHEDALTVFDAAAGGNQITALRLSRAPEPTPRAKEPAAPRPEPAHRAPARGAAAARAASGTAAPRAFFTPLQTAGGVLATTAVVVSATGFVGFFLTDRELDARRAELLQQTRAPYACGRSNPPAECVELWDLQDRRSLFFDVGWIGLATGGVLGAATLVSLLVAPTPGRVRVVLHATGQQAGVLVQGGW